MLRKFEGPNSGCLGTVALLRNLISFVLKGRENASPLLVCLGSLASAWDLFLSMEHGCQERQSKTFVRK